MEKTIAIIQYTAAAVGGGLSFVLGGFDRLIIFLALLTAIDVVTGILKGLATRQLNSEITLKGLIRKAGIYVIVAVCHLADQALNLTILRDGAISFYIVMELVSITENWGQIGLPLPEQLKKVLSQLNNNDTIKPTGTKLQVK